MSTQVHSQHAENPCRRILEKEIFAHFSVATEIEHIHFTDAHYTDALVAPLSGAPGLWIVFKWIERPFNFSLDAGYLEIVSPEACAKNPLNLTDPRRTVHLSLSANRYPGYNTQCTNSLLALMTPMAIEIEGRMPNRIKASSSSDSIVRKVFNFALDRSAEEIVKEAAQLKDAAHLSVHAPGLAIA